MTHVADPTMSYEGLVEAGRAAREQADNMQWVEGDLALQVESLPADEMPRDPETGQFIDPEKGLKVYAEDVGVPYGTLCNYRRAAEAWPVPQRCGTASWAVHYALATQADRFDLIRERMTYREAQKLVRDRTAGGRGKPGWLELMGMAADKMLAAGKDLAKLEAAIESKGDAAEITERMAEKADRYRVIAQDLADRFAVIGQLAESEDQAA